MSRRTACGEGGVRVGGAGVEDAISAREEDTMFAWSRRHVARVAAADNAPCDGADTPRSLLRGGEGRLRSGLRRSARAHRRRGLSSTLPQRPSPVSVAGTDDQVPRSPDEDALTPWRQVVAPAGAQPLIVRFCFGTLVTWEVGEPAGSTGSLILLQRANPHRRSHLNTDRRDAIPSARPSRFSSMAFHSQDQARRNLATTGVDS